MRLEAPCNCISSEALSRRQGASFSAGVLAFSDVMVDPSNFGRFGLCLYNCECFLRMDNAALQALNVMPQRVDVNDSFSLYGLLNRGKTAMSRRLLKVSALLLMRRSADHAQSQSPGSDDYTGLNARYL